ncbi:MAG: cellulase family glycosylhydrolase [Calditrichaceae bacterium]
MSIRKFLFILVLCRFLSGQEAPFDRGVNLTGWFQASAPEQIQFTKYTKQDFINIKSLGCDVIRLPINLHAMTSGEPDYNLHPLFLYFLDQAVSWAEDLEIHLILDNHTFDPASSTDPGIGDILIPVWKNMAAHYKNRSTYIFYEILNEPHGISDANWNAIQAEVIDSIRTIDTKHAIVVGPASWNSYNNLDDMPVYADDNLIYTFHFYDPFLFTHQGAAWTDPSMSSLSGVPFPYDADNMPVCPSDLLGTWIESELNNYDLKGNTNYVNTLIEIAANFKTSRNVPVFCGEFGVYIPNSQNGDRVYWYDVVHSALESHDIAWTTWDYQGGFGLFEKDSDELFDYNLNTSLLQALGLNVPPQDNFHIEPDTGKIPIYGDFTEPGIVQGGWISSGSLSYYSSQAPASGMYCIQWSGIDQYNTIVFDFQPDRDFSELVNQDYFLQFWLRGTPGTTSFDVRFIDTKLKDSDDHPWRMRYIIDDNLAVWDSSWHKISIPLSRFTEQGSWDNETWYNPVGKFNWAEIDRLEFAAEQANLNGSTIWLDNIDITNDTALTIRQNPHIPRNFILYQNYPNPFNPSTTISYYLSAGDKIEIIIYDILGKKVSTVFNGYKTPGHHSIVWNSTDLNHKKVSSGLYILRLKTSSGSKQRKIILLR